MIGKSIYIWQVAAIFGGDVGRIAAEVKAAGFESAILHSATLAGWRSVERVALANALKAVGVAPIGGAAVYGADPKAEGQQAAAICRDFGLSTFIFDAESAFDEVSDAPSAAVKLLWAFRAGVSAETLAGWCWWAFHHKPGGTGVYHPRAILSAAMHPDYGDADFGMPMDYWSWGDDPASAVRYLNESWSQWREVTDKPICPAGRAYIGDGGTARPDAMQAFEGRARELGVPGITWWSMQHAVDAVHLPGVWSALAGMPGFDQVEPEPEPTPNTATVVVDKLNMRFGPGVDQVIKGQLFKGTQAEVLEIIQVGKETWLRVNTESWVAAEYNGQTLVEVK